MLHQKYPPTDFTYLNMVWPSARLSPALSFLFLVMFRLAFHRQPALTEVTGLKKYSNSTDVCQLKTGASSLISYSCWNLEDNVFSAEPRRPT